MRLPDFFVVFPDGDEVAGFWTFSRERAELHAQVHQGVAYQVKAQRRKITMTAIADHMEEREVAA